MSMGTADWLIGEKCLGLEKPLIEKPLFLPTQSKKGYHGPDNRILYSLFPPDTDFTSLKSMCKVTRIVLVTLKCSYKCSRLHSRAGISYKTYGHISGYQAADDRIRRQ
jgi:hypothetical protein